MVYVCRFHRLALTTLTPKLSSLPPPAESSRERAALHSTSCNQHIAGHTLSTRTLTHQGRKRRPGRGNAQNIAMHHASVHHGVLHTGPGKPAPFKLPRVHVDCEASLVAVPGRSHIITPTHLRHGRESTHVLEPGDTHTEQRVRDRPRRIRRLRLVQSPVLALRLRRATV
jgi:hypothetical protein